MRIVISPQAGVGPRVEPVQPARHTCRSQARDAVENAPSSAAPAASLSQRPTGVTNPVLRLPRLAAGSGGRGTSATAALALSDAITFPDGSAARKNGST